MVDKAANYLGDDIMSALAVDSTPPSAKLSPGDWMKKNLFSNAANSIVSLIVGLAAAALVWFGLKWIINADFAIIRANLRIFLIGQFPKEELWRPWASAYVLILGAGLMTGAMARNSYELDISQELEPVKESWGQMVRRFWPVLLVSIFFVSFARTIMPYIGLAAAFVLIVVTRELGWRMPAAVRQRALYIGVLLFIVSMLVIAGTSRLGGYALGLVVFIWMMSELSQVETLPGGFVGTLVRAAIALVIAAAVAVIQNLIPHDGFGWENWGGLHISLFTTVVGITLGMPFGILLALGRKSNLPVLKTASVIFIEFVRGVPLISLLLFSNLMLPLFLPIDFERPADLTLAIVVITGFSAAYIAEIVRGGLQAVPKGQTEAAQASGMSAASVQRFIVLPQALRAVIPAMVGQFIALFKDTSLLSIIGILEFLRVSDTSNAQQEFVGKGLASVTYLFVAIGYWAFAYTMSKESRRLEAKLGVGHR